MTAVRVGILGLGSIGATHARVLADFTDQVRLTAVSGGPPGRPAELGYAGVDHVRPEDLVKHPQVDLVVICSPSGVHAEHALAALHAGKHVVVEKPLALTVEDAEAVVAAAAGRGLFLSAISQRRLESQHVHLKRLIDAGRLGRPVLGETFVHWHRDDAYYSHADWRPRQAHGGGSLMNQGVHNVDMLRWLLGPVSAVTGQYATLGHDMDAEDTTVATVRFRSGALGVVVTSTATPPGQPARLALFTSLGTAEFAHTDLVRWDFPDVPPPAALAEVASGAADPAAIGLAGHRAQWQDILDALRTGRPPAVTGEDAVQTVRLLCAIYQAAETGATVQFPSAV